MIPVRLLVLWDIEHTLIDTAGVGGEVFRAAFEAATGGHLSSMPDPTGLNESELFRRAARQSGVTGSDVLFQDFVRYQETGYRNRTAELRSRGRTLSGAKQALRAVAADPAVVSSVLSGDTRASGRAKLEAFGLAEFLQLDVGAGGEDDLVRRGLVPIAQSRAAGKHAARFDSTNTVVIGDTPSDIEAGHAHGCRVVSVATGRHGIEELRDAGADLVLADLTETARVVAAVLGSAGE